VLLSVAFGSPQGSGANAVLLAITVALFAASLRLLPPPRPEPADAG